MNKFRGYELFTPSMVMPAIVNLAHFDPERRLEKGESVQFENPHFIIQASIDWLHAQGFLRNKEGFIRATAKGRNLFSLSEAIAEYTGKYQDILSVLEGLLGWRGGPVPPMPKILRNNSEFAIDALIPPAVSFFHECPTKDDPGVSVGAQLIAGHQNLLDLLPETINFSEIEPFLEALKKRDLLVWEGNQNLRVSDRGKKVLSLGGFAELITSYYTTFPNLNDLVKGQRSYGLRGDVYRHAELNARASNGIIGIKVAPKIIELFEEDPTVCETLEKFGGFGLDFGSGGGEMVQKLLSLPQIKKVFGMDINPATVLEARTLANKKGLGQDQVEFLEGSIVDKKFLEKFKKDLGENAKPVCTINFILHDVGPDLTRRFLSNYRDVLGDAPLVITESFRVPLETMEDHPDQQASLFKYFHDLSGQHLYYKQEFEDLLAQEGFEIRTQTSHSSMLWEREDKRFKTIVTYIVQTSEEDENEDFQHSMFCA